MQSLKLLSTNHPHLFHFQPIGKLSSDQAIRWRLYFTKMTNLFKRNFVVRVSHFNQDLMTLGEMALFGGEAMATQGVAQECTKIKLREFEIEWRGE